MAEPAHGDLTDAPILALMKEEERRNLILVDLE
jgi:hypothetical protein